MAGQLLNSLQTNNRARAALSHEAKLGMMVITILMFAFGFLVYHKMDLQQQLTQAAIPSTAANGAVVEEAGHFENAGLLKPLSTSQQTPNAPTQLANLTEQPAASDPLFNMSDLSDGSPFGDAGMNVEQSSASSASGSGTDSATADSAAFADSVTPVFAFNEPPETAADENAASLAGEHESTAERGIAQAESRDEDVTFLQPESSASTAEPMPLTMVEPQQETGFSGGFITEDPSVSARNSTVSDVVESFPNVDSSDDNSRPETVLAAQESTPFGSGFEAVTQPSSRSSHRNSIRTAAGSGSDGKFSLSAFNYQNNSAEPAPDDGSTFDSTVVQDGDNYTKISKRIYGSGRYFSALAVFNQHRIPEPKKMRPGMVVLTPPVTLLEERYPQLFLDSRAKNVEPAAFLIMDDGSPAYRIGERETLSEISERFLGRSARWVEIYRLNQSTVKDPNKLKAGLILALPADATEVNVTP